MRRYLEWFEPLTNRPITVWHSYTVLRKGCSTGFPHQSRTISRLPCSRLADAAALCMLNSFLWSVPGAAGALAPIASQTLARPPSSLAPHRSSRYATLVVLPAAPRTEPRERNSCTWFPPWVHDGKAVLLPRMKSLRLREVVGGDRLDPLPRHAILLAAMP